MRRLEYGSSGKVASPPHACGKCVCVCLVTNALFTAIFHRDCVFDSPAARQVCLDHEMNVQTYQPELSVELYRLNYVAVVKLDLTILNNFSVYYLT